MLGQKASWWCDLQSREALAELDRRGQTGSESLRRVLLAWLIFLEITIIPFDIFAVVVNVVVVRLCKYIYALRRQAA